MQPTPSRHHPGMPLMLLLALIVPLIFALLYLQVVASSFRLFGLTYQQASVLLIGSLIGGMINIPLSRRRVALADPRLADMSPAMQMLATIFHFYPPATVEEVVAVNVGGALVPLGLSIYLLVRYPELIGLAILGVVLVAFVAKLLARPVPGLGITLPGFIPPIVAAVVALGLARIIGSADGMAAVGPVAYISGALGTLIGADLLNLPLVLRGGLLAAGPQRFWRLGPQVPTDPRQPRVVSIGGAGVFDGIFLTGIIAAFLVQLA
ncbi:MAG TPA: DUF1614 domain-containing protein [Ktedonobacterales bacterium]